MFLGAEARDCLYVNWAIPLAQAPPLPPPLRYELHPAGGPVGTKKAGEKGGDTVFFSALCFHLSGLHPELLPLLRISYPQLTFRTYVLDGDNVPSVLFVRVWVPFWVAPLSRWIGGQPASPGFFRFPPPTRQRLQDNFRWQVRSHQALEIAARVAAPIAGGRPSLGSFERTVEYFRRRPRGYVIVGGDVRAIDRSHPQVDVLPLAVEIEDDSLLRAAWPGVAGEIWQAPHSAWLCPDIPFSFELGPPIQLPLPAMSSMPAAQARF
jgi:hypothetical protein